MELMLKDISDGNNILYLGPGGGGKSFFICQLYTQLNKNVEILCSTGQACISVNGNTYHSFFPWKKSGFFGVPLKDLMDDISPTILSGVIDNFKQKSYKRKIKDLDVIIFDEFSMINNSHFISMDKVCRACRKNNLPFGGIQVIICGDPFQLPPVMDKFPFSSPVWDELNLKYYNLSSNHLHRYLTKDFSDITRIIRLGILPAKVKDILETRIITPDTKITEIYYDNATADESNIKQYTELQAEEHVYPSSFKIKALFVSKIDKTKRELTISVNKGIIEDFSNIPSEYKTELTNVVNTWFKHFTKDMEKIYGQKYLEPSFKIGTRIICTKNHKDKTYCNGTSGNIVSCNPDSIEIQTINKKIKIDYTDTDLIKTINSETHEIMIKFTFFHIPIRLGYAITYNRSQGMTMDSVNISDKLLKKIPGIIYVGISRCRSLDTLYFSGNILNKLAVSVEVIEKFKDHFIQELIFLDTEQPTWLEDYKLCLPSSIKNDDKSVYGIITTINQVKNRNSMGLDLNNTGSEYLTKSRGADQQKLRKWLIEHEGRCIISEENVSDILEAAHIKNYCEFKEGENSHEGNGILLRCDLHTLFDKHYFGINPQGEIILSKTLESHPVYSQFKKIVWPLYINRDYINSRFELFCLSNNNAIKEKENE